MDVSANVLSPPGQREDPPPALQLDSPQQQRSPRPDENLSFGKSGSNADAATANPTTATTTATITAADSNADTKSPPELSQGQPFGLPAMFPDLVSAAASATAAAAGGGVLYEATGVDGHCGAPGDQRNPPTPHNGPSGGGLIPAMSSPLPHLSPPSLLRRGSGQHNYHHHHHIDPYISPASAGGSGSAGIFANYPGMLAFDQGSPIAIAVSFPATPHSLSAHPYNRHHQHQQHQYQRYHHNPHARFFPPGFSPGGGPPLMGTLSTPTVLLQGSPQLSLPFGGSSGHSLSILRDAGLAMAGGGGGGDGDFPREDSFAAVSLNSLAWAHSAMGGGAAVTSSPASGGSVSGGVYNIHNSNNTSVYGGPGAVAAGLITDSSAYRHLRVPPVQHPLVPPGMSPAEGRTPAVSAATTATTAATAMHRPAVTVGKCILDSAPRPIMGLGCDFGNSISTHATSINVLGGGGGEEPVSPHASSGLRTRPVTGGGGGFLTTVGASHQDEFRAIPEEDYLFSPADQQASSHASSSARHSASYQPLRHPFPGGDAMGSPPPLGVSAGSPGSPVVGDGDGGASEGASSPSNLVSPTTPPSAVVTTTARLDPGEVVPSPTATGATKPKKTVAGKWLKKQQQQQPQQQRTAAAGADKAAETADSDLPTKLDHTARPEREGEESRGSGGSVGTDSIAEAIRSVKEESVAAEQAARSLAECREEHGAARRLTAVPTASDAACDGDDDADVMRDENATGFLSPPPPPGHDRASHFRGPAATDHHNHNSHSSNNSVSADGGGHHHHHHRHSRPPYTRNGSVGEDHDEDDDRTNCGSSNNSTSVRNGLNLVSIVGARRGTTLSSVLASVTDAGGGEDDDEEEEEEEEEYHAVSASRDANSIGTDVVNSEEEDEGGRTITSVPAAAPGSRNGSRADRYESTPFNDRDELVQKFSSINYSISSDSELLGSPQQATHHNHNSNQHQYFVLHTVRQQSGSCGSCGGGGGGGGVSPGSPGRGGGGRRGQRRRGGRAGSVQSLSVDPILLSEAHNQHQQQQHSPNSPNNNSGGGGASGGNLLLPHDGFFPDPHTPWNVRNKPPLIQSLAAGLDRDGSPKSSSAVLPPTSQYAQAYLQQHYVGAGGSGGNSNMAASLSAANSNYLGLHNGANSIIHNNSAYTLNHFAMSSGSSPPMAVGHVRGSSDAGAGVGGGGIGGTGRTPPASEPLCILEEMSDLTDLVRLFATDVGNVRLPIAPQLYTVRGRAATAFTGLLSLHDLITGLAAAGRPSGSGGGGGVVLTTAAAASAASPPLPTGAPRAFGATAAPEVAVAWQAVRAQCVSVVADTLPALTEVAEVTRTARATLKRKELIAMWTLEALNEARSRLEEVVEYINGSVGGAHNRNNSFSRRRSPRQYLAPSSAANNSNNANTTGSTPPPTTPPQAIHQHGLLPKSNLPTPTNGNDGGGAGDDSNSNANSDRESRLGPLAQAPALDEDLIDTLSSSLIKGLSASPGADSISFRAGWAQSPCLLAARQRHSSLSYPSLAAVTAAAAAGGGRAGSAASSGVRGPRGGDGGGDPADRRQDIAAAADMTIRGLCMWVSGERQLREELDGAHRGLVHEAQLALMRVALLRVLAAECAASAGVGADGNDNDNDDGDDDGGDGGSPLNKPGAREGAAVPSRPVGNIEDRGGGGSGEGTDDSTGSGADHTSDDSGPPPQEQQQQQEQQEPIGRSPRGPAALTPLGTVFLAIDPHREADDKDDSDDEIESCARQLHTTVLGLLSRAPPFHHNQQQQQHRPVQGPLHLSDLPTFRDVHGNFSDMEESEGWTWWYGWLLATHVSPHRRHASQRFAEGHARSFLEQTDAGRRLVSCLVRTGGPRADVAAARQWITERLAVAEARLHAADSRYTLRTRHLLQLMLRRIVLLACTANSSGGGAVGGVVDSDDGTSPPLFPQSPPHYHPTSAARLASTTVETPLSNSPQRQTPSVASAVAVVLSRLDAHVQSVVAAKADLDALSALANRDDQQLQHYLAKWRTVQRHDTADAALLTLTFASSSSRNSSGGFGLGGGGGGNTSPNSNSNSNSTATAAAAASAANAQRRLSTLSHGCSSASCRYCRGDGLFSSLVDRLLVVRAALDAVEIGAALLAGLMRRSGANDDSGGGGLPHHGPGRGNGAYSRQSSMASRRSFQYTTYNSTLVMAAEMDSLSVHRRPDSVGGSSSSSGGGGGSGGGHAPPLHVSISHNEMLGDTRTSAFLDADTEQEAEAEAEAAGRPVKDDDNKDDYGNDTVVARSNNSHSTSNNTNSMNFAAVAAELSMGSPSQNCLASGATFSSSVTAATEEDDENDGDYEDGDSREGNYPPLPRCGGHNHNLHHRVPHPHRRESNNASYGVLDSRTPPLLGTSVSPEQYGHHHTHHHHQNSSSAIRALPAVLHSPFHPSHSHGLYYSSHHNRSHTLSESHSLRISSQLQQQQRQLLRHGAVADMAGTTTTTTTTAGGGREWLVPRTTGRALARLEDSMDNLLASVRRNLQAQLQ